MKVKFLSNAKGLQGEVFYKDDVIELDDARAIAGIKKGICVEVVEEIKPKKTKKK